MRKPNFFIVGAPKCGTTSLSEYLRSHPRIFVTSPKEPFYFCADFPGIRKVDSQSEYFELFRKADSRHLAVGEATTIYLYSTEALWRIREFNPNARIIVMLRNPLHLLPAFHSQLLFSFHEDQREFSAAWHLQSQRADGHSIPRFCRAAELLQYRNVGMLGQQVERLLKDFPREQIQFVFFDDFANQTTATYEKVLTFLQVPSDQRREFPRLNQNKAHRSRSIESVRRELVERFPTAGQILRASVELLGFHEPLKSALRKTMPREPLSAELHDLLEQTFAEDIQLLSALTGRALNHWTVPTRTAA